jgi:sialic acid synthase SpsE
MGFDTISEHGVFRVGSGPGCFIIGEVAQAHDGSLGMAHAYIDAIANSGADAVKFQTHIAAAESTPGEPWRVKFSEQDAARYDYWTRMEFTEPQWRGLKERAGSPVSQFARFRRALVLLTRGRELHQGCKVD